MIYKGQIPLLEQPKLGSKNIERIFRGSQLVYGNPVPPVPVVTRDIFAWYDAQDSTLVGTTISDLSGNSRTATTINSPVQSVEGFFFDGGNKQIQTSFLDSTLDGSNRTIECWVRYTVGVSFPSNTSICINGTGGALFGMSAVLAGPVGDIMRSTNNQLAQTSGQPAGGVNDNLYHQYVVRRAGATISLHKDGVAYGTPGTNASVTALINKNVVFDIMGGHESRFISGTGAYLAIARFYNTNLSDAEILQNFNASTGKYV